MAFSSYYPSEYDILPQAGGSKQPKEIPVEFLMPNGLFLRMNCGRDDRLAHIKSQVSTLLLMRVVILFY